MERRKSLSVIIGEICDDPVPTVTVGEIVRLFGQRAFGALLFLFSALSWLPLPPGSSTFLALPLLLLAPQMAIGSHGPWLPRFIGQRPIDRASLAVGLRKMLPALRRIESLSRPRLPILFGPVGDRFIGLTITLLALVMLLPIPLANMAPGAAVAVFGLALVQRDGVLALTGYAISAVSAGLLVIGGQAALYALKGLLRLMGAA